jgi:hypothetical protein
VKLSAAPVAKHTVYRIFIEFDQPIIQPLSEQSLGKPPAHVAILLLRIHC